MTTRRFACPIGPLRLSARDGRLVRIAFDPPREKGLSAHPADDAGRAVLDQACAQLEQYFAGTRHRFELPLAPVGSSFQRSVWAALQRIPYGQTRSYRQVAQAVGRANASRAVGAANGANPLPIVVPCHRVIASDGLLSGFAGGVAVKRRLLDHERAGAGLFADATG